MAAASHALTAGLRIVWQQEDVAVDTSEGQTPDFDAEAKRKRAEMAKPMAAAPMRYNDDGTVDWGNMWDSFCVLASAGGPPHRGTLLQPDESVDINSEGYQNTAKEIIRGIFLVSGLRAQLTDKPGWLAVPCDSEGMAEWVAEQAKHENVKFTHEGNHVYVPCGVDWPVKGEVKNVITVVAKTTHYWQDHIAREMKTAMAAEDALNKIGDKLKGLFGRK